ncbi:MAG: DUF1838 family protein [Pseudomonadota bacterium]
MRIARLFAVCFAFCAVAGPAVAAESGPPEDVAAVKAFGDTWISFYEAGDVDGLLGLYEPDAWLMTRDQPAKVGRDGVIYMHTAGLKLDSWDQLSDTMKREIDRHYPDYVGPPPLDDDRKNVTSWMYYKRVTEGEEEAPDRR